MEMQPISRSDFRRIQKIRTNRRKADRRTKYIRLGRIAIDLREVK